jgi:hypothetical protein
LPSYIWRCNFCSKIKLLCLCEFGIKLCYIYCLWKIMGHVVCVRGIDVFVNCNLVVTRWQYTFTHKQYIEQHKQLMWKSAGRAPSLRVLPWHLPYNWGKITKKNLSRGKKNLSQVKKNHQSEYSLHITKTPTQTHTLQNPHTYYKNPHNSLQNPHNITENSSLISDHRCIVPAVYIRSYYWLEEM